MYDPISEILRDNSDGPGIFKNTILDFERTLVDNSGNKKILCIGDGVYESNNFMIIINIFKDFDGVCIFELRDYGIDHESKFVTLEEMSF